MLYFGFPGLGSTTVVKVFHGVKYEFLFMIAMYSGQSLSMRSSAHLISTIFGIPSGPGALNGLRRAICFRICSLEIGSILQTGAGCAWSSKVLGVCWGF